MSVLVCRHWALYHYSMLLQHLRHLCFELTTIIALEYLSIAERTNLVNFDNHFGYVFHLFHSQRSGNFVFGSNVDFRENVLVLISIIYHWACTTSGTDVSHWELSLHNKVC